MRRDSMFKSIKALTLILVLLMAVLMLSGCG